METKKLLIEGCTWQQFTTRFDFIDERIDGLYKIVGNGNSGSNLPLYLSIQEASDFLNISRRTCYRWLSSGIIKAHQVPGSKSILISREEILTKLK